LLGVVPKSNWNEAVGSSGSGLALVDETGTATGASISWSSKSIFRLPIVDTPGDFRMMNGYLDPVGQNAVVTVTNLPVVSGGYDVYLYADGANAGATRNSTYQISGTGITTTSVNLIDAPNTNFSGTYTQANNSQGNFVKFSIAATSFTITAIPGTGSDGTKRAPINGLQIVPSTAADFSISVSPSSQTLNPGNSTTYTVTIGALNGFSGVVTLSASGLPSGASAGFSPATITGSGTSTMTVTTGTGAPTGNSTLSITGTSGSLTHSATATLVVASAADFSIFASPSSQTVNPGNSTTYTVTIGALNGFSGVVTLSASGLPAGASAGFSPATITGSGTSTMTVTTGTGTLTGNSTLSITGSSGTLTHSATATLVVAVLVSPDFSIAVSPSSQTVNPGNSTTYTVTIGALDGFSGVVTLSASGLPSGASAGFSPATITGSGTSTMTVTDGTNTSLGTSALTLSGTSGSTVHSATANLVVIGAISIDFVGSDISMAPTEMAGVVPKASWNEATGPNGSGIPLVDEIGTAANASVTWTSSSVFELPITDTPGNFRMMKGYLDTVGQNTVVTVTNLPQRAAGYDIYVYADGTNWGATRTGTYQISGAGIITTSITLTDAAKTDFSGTFLQANNSSGNYVKFTITATGFTLTAIPGPASDGTKRAPVNGIQIIPH
jgi:hypothetical protein